MQAMDLRWRIIRGKAVADKKYKEIFGDTTYIV